MHADCCENQRPASSGSAAKLQRGLLDSTELQDTCIKDDTATSDICLIF
jgi:hypothetical protein